MIDTHPSRVPRLPNRGEPRSLGRHGKRGCECQMRLVYRMSDGTYFGLVFFWRNYKDNSQALRTPEAARAWLARAHGPEGCPPPGARRRRRTPTPVVN